MLFHILVFCKSKYKLNACKKKNLKYEGLLLDPSNHKIISLIKKISLLCFKFLVNWYLFQKSTCKICFKKLLQTGYKITILVLIGSLIVCDGICATH